MGRWMVSLFLIHVAAIELQFKRTVPSRSWASDEDCGLTPRLFSISSGSTCSDSALVSPRPSTDLLR